MHVRILLTLGALTAIAPLQTGIDGTWNGTLGSGRGALRIELRLSTLPDGSIAGQLNSLDQGARLPMTSIRLDNGKLHFEIPSVGGVYDGSIDASGVEISGRWTQTGVPPQPLNFRRASTAAPAATAPEKPAADEKGPPFTSPLDIRAPVPPQPFRGGGKTYLAYELHAANYSGRDCWLTALAVLGDSSATPIASYSSADLETMAARPLRDEPPPYTKIAAGSTTVVYMWIALDSPQVVPAALRHLVTVRVTGFSDSLTFEIPALAVNRAAVPVLGAPLRGDGWVAGNGPSNMSIHRRALIPVNGRAWISQRFAIDWVRPFSDGKTCHGAQNTDCRAYGEPAIAVADGVVSEIKDGIPQNVPGDTRAVPITLETIGGNHVILDLGGNVFAVYAHLQPESLRVRVGDRVTRGQVLGLVGNSGNSTEPHLHFHLCTGSSVLACEGLPYAVASGEMPLDRETVRFER